MWPRVALMAVVLCCGVRIAAAEGPVCTRAVVRQNPTQHLFVARVDLSDPRVSLAVANGGPDPDGPGPWETVLRPTSFIARANDFALAINTVFFAHASPDGDPKKYVAGQGAAALNLVVIDGRPATPNLSGAGLWVDAGGRAHVGMIEGRVPPGARQAAAGSRLIVQGGRNVAGEGDGARHPRTAAGVSADGRTLVLIVADGRRPGWAIGLTLTELADELIAQGCVDGINFDGGGSATMVARTPDGRHRVLNTPSDGSTFIVPLSIERPVPYALGVRVKSN